MRKHVNLVASFALILSSPTLADAQAIVAVKPIASPVDPALYRAVLYAQSLPEIPDKFVLGRDYYDWLSSLDGYVISEHHDLDEFLRPVQTRISRDQGFNDQSVITLAKCENEGNDHVGSVALKEYMSKADWQERLDFLKAQDILDASAQPPFFEVYGYLEWRVEEFDFATGESLGTKMEKPQQGEIAFVDIHGSQSENESPLVTDKGDAFLSVQIDFACE